MDNETLNRLLWAKKRIKLYASERYDQQDGTILFKVRSRQLDGYEPPYVVVNCYCTISGIFGKIERMWLDNLPIVRPPKRPDYTFIQFKPYQSEESYVATSEYYQQDESSEVSQPSEG